MKVGERSVGLAFKPGAELLHAFQSELKDLDIDWLIPNEKPNEDWVLENLMGVDIYVGWNPPEKLLRDSEKLKLVLNPGAGIWHQLKELKQVYKEEGITLCNGHGNDYYTAQHAVGLLLAACNKLGIHERLLRSGKWRSSDADGASIPLLNRKVGLLGYGHINRYVHRFLQGFDLDFHVLRRNWKGKNVPDYRYDTLYENIQLKEFLSAIDTLIVAVPELPETTGMIGAEELSLLGQNSVLVNVARGKVIDEEALFNALKSKQLIAAGIDVWYDYNPDPDKDGRKYPYHHPFHELDHLFMSPHRGGSPLESLYRWQDIFNNIRAFYLDEKLSNVVDLDAGY